MKLYHLVTILFCLGQTLASTDNFTRFFDLLNGLKADDYVPGSFACAENVEATYIDYTNIQTYFSSDNEANRPTDTKERNEEAFFKTIESVTANLPNTIYNCYFIPMMSAYRWRGHIAKFQDSNDFWAGFAQNLMGNALTIEYTLGEINTANAAGDETAVIYAMGKLARRIFDF